MESNLISASKPITSIPIPSRPAQSSYLQSLAFGLLFNSCIIFTNLTQFLFLPLNFFSSTKPYYESLLSYTKLAFGRTLVLISQFFGPTKLVLSWEDQDGKTLDPELFVSRDQKGKIVKIEMPHRSVWMANHQVYTDWLYLWCVAYYSDLADSILIILKASLKHIPFVGWGMQFYRFIFLARSWAADKTYLGRHLSFMTDRSRQSSSSGPNSGLPKLLLLIFPEGTLISENTQPISRKYAEKNGIEDRTNVLLPRSTGLMFCLRALRREVDDLKLVDFTIGYPGVPPAGYGQSFYTLRSIFMQGDPPPAVHIRCTVTPVNTSSSSSSNSISSPPPLGVLPSSRPGESDTSEASTEEKEAFDKWLQKRWAHKDSLMENFYRDGDFNGGEFSRSKEAGEYRRKGEFIKNDGLSDGKKGFVEIPVRLRSNWEIGDSMIWCAPIWVGLAVSWAWKSYSK